MRKKRLCHGCEWAAGNPQYDRIECNYISHHDESRTVQAYRACGVDHATEETDRMLSGYTCAFYEPGARRRTVHSGIALPRSIPHVKPRRINKAPMYDWGRALELHRQGAEAKEIAAVLGCTKGAVDAWRRREGLRVEKPEHLFDYDKAGELFRAGATVEAVAAAIGCAYKTAQKYKTQLGLSKPKTDWLTGRELLESGATPRVVARELGVKERTVLEWARREGLVWKDAKDAPVS